MQRSRPDRFQTYFAAGALALLAAITLPALAAAPKPDATRAIEPYVVDRVPGLAVALPVKSTVGEPSGDPDALEAAAREKHDMASKQAGFAALTLLIAPLGLFSYNPQAVAAPFVLSYRAMKSKEGAERLDDDAAHLRKKIGCFEKIVDDHPGLRERLPDALNDGALLREFRDRIGTAIELRTNHLPISVAGAHDEALGGEKLLAEAARLQLRDLVDIDIESMSLVVEPAPGADAGCTCKIATRAGIRLWNVAGSRVVFQDDLQEAMPVQADELALLLDQPRALRARMAIWYGDLVLASMARANVRFSQAPQ